jgi:hypothetical protein
MARNVGTSTTARNVGTSTMARNVGAPTIALVGSGQSAMRSKTSSWSNENVVPGEKNVVPRETEFVRKECDSNRDSFER